MSPYLPSVAGVQAQAWPSGVLLDFSLGVLTHTLTFKYICELEAFYFAGLQPRRCLRYLRLFSLAALNVAGAKLT